MAACLALPFSAQGGDQLYVPAGPIDPVTESSKANTHNSSYGIVQFSEKSGMSAKAIQALGAEVVAYLPESAYIVRLGNSSLSGSSNIILSSVDLAAWSGPWHPGVLNDLIEPKKKAEYCLGIGRFHTNSFGSEFLLRWFYQQLHTFSF